mmetsp:Transcript_11846/g.31087  ORF Transcript_11846/g.31087 Transcript_11846/m.31087 type:complete len:216 (+) Transcript_11846:1065-1712(+)
MEPLDDRFRLLFRGEDFLQSFQGIDRQSGSTFRHSPPHPVKITPELARRDRQRYSSILGPFRIQGRRPHDAGGRLAPHRNIRSFRTEDVLQIRQILRIEFPMLREGVAAVPDGLLCLILHLLPMERDRRAGRHLIFWRDRRRNFRRRRRLQFMELPEPRLQLFTTPIHLHAREDALRGHPKFLHLEVRGQRVGRVLLNLGLALGEHGVQGVGRRL